MLIGCCCPIERVEDARDAGFDYVECTVVSLRPEEDSAEAEEILTVYSSAVLPVRAFNVFLPGDLKIAGPKVDQKRMQRYLESALARIQRTDAQRNVPAIH